MIKNRSQLERVVELNKIYQWLCRNNPTLLDKLLPLNNTKWTLELCKTIALKYNTRTDWSNNDRKSYKIALKNKWLEECCAHMPKNANFRKTKNIDTGEIFYSASEAELIYKLSSGSINSVISGKQKTAGGYHWAYCDKNGNILK